MIPVAEYTKKLPEEQDFLTNCYVAPGFDSLKLLNDLKNKVNQPIGSIEQTYLYVTDRGFMAHMRLINQEDYLIYSSSIPLENIAEAIGLRLSKTSHDQHSLDILALGPGLAREECRLVQILRKRSPIQKIRLFLFDVSSHYLWSARARSKEILASEPGVEVIPILGNFHELQTCDSLLHTSLRANRALLVTMLGATWSNLDNEADFLRYRLDALPHNAFFLVDMMRCFAPANQPEQILKADPRLQGNINWQDKQCLAPILTFREGVTEKDVEFVSLLDNHSACIPNSYVVELKAIIKEEAKLIMHRFKRYDIPSLGEFFGRYNWDLMRTLPYWDNRAAICLFQRNHS